jgi:hypothetical protein
VTSAPGAVGGEQYVDSRRKRGVALWASIVGFITALMRIVILDLLEVVATTTPHELREDLP